MSTLWLIPARGGSKGIPGKNIKEFCGEPLVVRAIRQAERCASQRDDVFISTDSPTIKAIVENHGFPVPFLRPGNLATDTSGSFEVIFHAEDEFRKMNKPHKRIVLLQPTSPLRSDEDIHQALALWNENIDMVTTVCRSEANPYYNLFETDSSGFLRISKGEGKYRRRQDAPPVWEYNGAVYVISTDSLKKGSFGNFSRILPSIMTQERSIDLDTPLDWEIAEKLAERMKTDLYG